MQYFFFNLSDAPIVDWLQPLTKDELSTRGVVDMLFDIDYLLQLYPSIPGGGNIPKMLLKQLRGKIEQKTKESKYTECKLIWAINEKG